MIPYAATPHLHHGGARSSSVNSVCVKAARGHQGRARPGGVLGLWASSSTEAPRAIGRSYAYYIVAGTRVPHPRHYPNLAALVGVALPRTFAAALSSPEES